MENRQQIAILVKDWSSRNADKIAIYSARTLAKRQQALSECLPENKQYMKEVEQIKHCEITGVTVTVETDHIMPISKGRWGNTEGNLLRLYQPLNSSKGNANVFDWIDQMEQERLNYLLPKGIEMTTEQFRQKVLNVLAVKAEEKGLTLEQYKQEYIEEYGRSVY